MRGDAEGGVEEFHVELLHGLKFRSLLDGRGGEELVRNVQTRANEIRELNAAWKQILGDERASAVFK